MEGDCGYCYQAIHIQDYLECIECEQYIHVKCLKRPGTPGDFSGDVFFTFKCVNCTISGSESFERQSLPWAVIIALTIYNLSINSPGLSHHGYYHWRTHIAYFIDKNWLHIMGPNVKRRKKWIGTISGTLSHNSPSLFVSGSNVCNETGWWKLTSNVTPIKFYELFKKLRREKVSSNVINIDDSFAQIAPGKRSRESTEEEFEPDPPVFSRTLPYMGCIPHKKQSIIKSEPSIDIFDFMDTSNYSDFLDDLELDPNPIATDLIPSFHNSLDNQVWTDSLSDYVFGDTNDTTAKNSNDLSEEAFVVQVTNYQEMNCRNKVSNKLNNIESNNKPASQVPTPNASNNQPDSGVDNGKKEEEEEEEEEIPYEIKYPCRKSLFSVKTAGAASVSAQPPWELEVTDKHVTNDDTEDFCGDNHIEIMSEYEENETHKRLKSILSQIVTKQDIDVPYWIRRYYRKLCVRKMQRSVGKTVFNIDDFNKIKLCGKRKTVETVSVLDRFQQLITTPNDTIQSRSLHARLSGTCHYEVFISPHTGRELRPFIYRNDQCVSPWIKLMCELQYVVNDRMPTRSSIDYCYVRPQHIAAVNALLQRLFWPGIDMSECLSYPDFSVIALYKKLVVGCAFLVPDVGHNEAYVSFMAVRPGWQRAGIAQFMLYHLTQTCMGKDITLHVSATNPAICLYQKFGFKIEELILDFYEKFLPIESTQSRHAFLLRMER